MPGPKTDELNLKYTELCKLLGDKVYKITTPFLEAWEILMAMRSVSREAGKLLERPKKT